MTEGVREDRVQSGGAEQMHGRAGAGSATQRAEEATRQVASTAADQAKSVVAEAGEQARDLAGQARSQMRDQAQVQQHRATERIRAIGDELNAMADKGGQSGMATELTREASRRMHSLAGWLQDHEPSDVLEAVREAARRRPGLFLTGAAVAGIVLGRVTRAAVAGGGAGGGAVQATGQTGTSSERAAHGVPPAGSPVSPGPGPATEPRPAPVPPSSGVVPGAPARDPIPGRETP